jgi:adenylate kinase family enzyme
MSALRPAVVALSGPIGSGKTTAARLLSQRTGWPHTSYGDVVRAEAGRAGLPQDRHQLQLVGTQLIAAGWHPFTLRVLEQVSWRPDDALIIEGIRHAEAVAALRQITAPIPVAVIFLDLPVEAGLARAAARDRPDGTAGCRDAAHPIEQDLLGVRDSADLVVPVPGLTPEAITERILTHLTDLHQMPSRRQRA